MEPKQKQVLIVNDDGIKSEGIHALAHFFAEMDWEITIVAPAHNQSGKSFSLTFNEPVRVEAVSPRELKNIADIKCYKVYGTPLDCVNLGLKQLTRSQPDLLISGINAGANISFNILYSGTVSAAIEGARHKIPAIALSVDNYTPEKHLYQTAVTTLKEIMAKYPFDYRSVYNINIPNHDSKSPAIIETSVLEGIPGGFYDEVSPGHYQLMEEDHDLSVEKTGHLPTDVETLQKGNVSLSILPVGN